ncbi:hypothetical protein [Streptomyces sp. NPDC048521]|uniref:hypothetical protein n=1 Tax=Streptomyces sp. NPDC048521 TaxID=3365566 RepID=UPI003717BE2C
MTEIPTTEPAVVSAEEEAAFAVMSADAVLTGRVMMTGQAVSSAEFWAGLLAAALVDTAGSPRKLPADMWPEQDPVVVQEIWDRAAVVVSRAAQFAASPWLHRDRLQGLQERLAEAGFHAMAGSVQRSLRLVVSGHPADSEIGREH